MRAVTKFFEADWRLVLWTAGELARTWYARSFFGFGVRCGHAFALWPLTPHEKQVMVVV